MGDQESANSKDDVDENIESLLASDSDDEDVSEIAEVHVGEALASESQILDIHVDDIAFSEVYT